ncbi:Hcp family type VI secretion system effector [Dickeya fangzhongdai]|uniref:Type VI secretion system tube protein Hcp n=1 Tax=Dickeya fangzhongdai TaxID=1778540 RepID=A0A2K8QSD0_9GAMM|nr:Hcp family type VI secretion system effector [Dickeya fangzhongdai]ATZ96005.1 type VI secretion system tube protein Hcp [Dickeya fangzhongdai]QOH49448.1 Hcp family type VI secretion system effector [Dickeya fangzhongdai]QOH53752.1 Hcp family type VI secretion system effector [Dickeya fangzhongdai]WOX99042.1 Hcp family type VI secretion system effector [Dickeya fangzhongdai]WOY05806.1 Hcp family type VI secretion system effector [Dickeya fangzhongdai]
MANIIYLSIEGKSQGLISSGCGSYDSIGNKWQKGHEDEILVYELNNWVDRVDNVNYHPVEIRKPIDKSTPLLLTALNDNEYLECKFLFYRTNGNGSLEVYFSITLQNAKINNIKMNYPNSATHNDSQPDEMISFTYKTMLCEHIKAGTSAYCLWDSSLF